MPFPRSNNPAVIVFIAAVIGLKRAQRLIARFDFAGTACLATTGALLLANRPASTSSPPTLPKPTTSCLTAQP